MKCFNCRSEMLNHYIRINNKTEISYDVCEECESFWLDRGELDRMLPAVKGSIERIATGNPLEQTPTRRKCPRCEDFPLNQFFFLKFEDIVLDSCPNCGGYWLDGGEMELISDRIKEIMQVKGCGIFEFLARIHWPYHIQRGRLHYWRRKSRETDFSVEVPPVLGAELRAETPWDCPECGKRLFLYKKDEVEFEGCYYCRGVWLDKDEFRLLKDKYGDNTDFSLRWLDDEIDAVEQQEIQSFPAGRECPKCRVEMETAYFGHSEIMIDICPQCTGVWLDRDEFDGICRFLHRKLQRMSLTEMSAKVLEEIKEVGSGTERFWDEIRDAESALSTLAGFCLLDNPYLAKTFFYFRFKLCNFRPTNASKIFLSYTNFHI